MLLAFTSIKVEYQANMLETDKPFVVLHPSTHILWRPPVKTQADNKESEARFKPLLRLQLSCPQLYQTASKQFSTVSRPIGARQLEEDIEELSDESDLGSILDLAFEDQSCIKDTNLHTAEEPQQALVDDSFSKKIRVGSNSNSTEPQKRSFRKPRLLQPDALAGPDSRRPVAPELTLSKFRPIHDFTSEFSRNRDFFVNSTMVASEASQNRRRLKRHKSCFESFSETGADLSLSITRESKRRSPLKLGVETDSSPKQGSHERYAKDGAQVSFFPYDMKAVEEAALKAERKSRQRHQRAIEGRLRTSSPSKQRLDDIDTAQITSFDTILTEQDEFTDLHAKGRRGRDRDARTELLQISQVLNQATTDTEHTSRNSDIEPQGKVAKLGKADTRSSKISLKKYLGINPFRKT